MDMLKLLQDVEQSQVQLQEAVKQPEQQPERRNDNDVNATPSKLLDMEKIVKALEVTTPWTIHSLTHF
jgi:hypothetical protein